MKRGSFFPKEEYTLLMQGDDYYAIDEDLSYFFENDREEWKTQAAEEPFAAYVVVYLYERSI